MEPFFKVTQMNRLQNLIVIIWGLALLLFIAFNWDLVNRDVDISFLFMDFQVSSLLMWLALPAFLVPLVLRLISSAMQTTIVRRTEKEISSIKSKAYDGLSSEFTRLGEKLEGQLNSQLKSIRAAQATAAEPGKTEEEAGEKKKEKSAKS